LVDTILLLISSISGAIHGRVPLIPPETIVVCFTLDKPKSDTCNHNLSVAPFQLFGKEEAIYTVSRQMPWRREGQKQRIGWRNSV